MQRSFSNPTMRRNRRALAIASSVLCLGAAGRVASANTTATWIGPAGMGGSGNWTDVGSWSTGVVPENNSNTSYDVAIDGGNPASSTVTIGSESFQIDNLTVNADDALDLGDGASLTLAGDGLAATATVNGLINLDSAGSNTDLIIAGNTSLTGTGTVQFSNEATNRLYASGNQTLTISSGQTIAGAGQIGMGQTVIVNNGTIDANASAGMIIDPGSEGFTNNHLIEASGAFLVMVGSFNNTSGTISALTGGELQFAGSTVTRGILATTGTGFIDFTSTDTLSNVTINGDSNEENGAVVTIAGGALANNGNYSLSSTGNFTDLEVNANTSINGTGTVQLSNFTNNRIYASNNQTLTVGSGQTIQGSGQIGVSQTVLVNNGIIAADSSAGLSIDVSKSASTNSNLIEATSGATLTLTGQLTNTGSGAITATDTAAIILNSANIFGNSITGSATGMITSFGTSALNNLTVNGPLVNNSGIVAFNAVVLNGNYTASSGSITDASGTLTNNALFTLGSAEGNTDLVITANTLLSGTGTLQMSNFVENRIYAASGQTLTIGSGQTIQGAGQLGIGETSFVNNGVIDANASAGITISPGTGGFTNNNLLEAADGAVLTLQGSFTNTAAFIDALPDAGVKLLAASVSGGIFSTTGNGFVDFAFNDTINNVTLNGNCIEENAATVTVAGGALTNSGTYTMNATFANTDLAVNSNTTISGIGTFQLSDNAGNRIYAAGNQTLTIGSGQTIQGAGQIGLSQTVLVNDGIINASASAGLTINVSGTASVNNGSMEATSGATLQLLGAMTNLGILTSDSASTILIGGVFSQTGGTLFNPGSLVVTGALATSPGSLLTNTGALKIDQGGTATISTRLAGGGNVNVGDPSGSASQLTVQSIAQNSLLINATGFVTIASNTTTATNTLNSLTINNGGTLNLTNNHLFIHYGSGPDPIASVAAWIASGFNGGAWNGAGIDSSVAAITPGYALGYADSADPGNPANLPSGTIEIKYTLLGDANLDGIVNGIDFGILAANFNKGVTGWDEGDFNYDNVVNGIDFGELAANFNKGASGADYGPGALSDPALVAFAQANGLMADVPEPACIALIAVSAPSLLRRRRRV
jgi:hypothetical protein